VKCITKRSFEFIKGDIRDQATLLKVMRGFVPDIVINFAGLKAVHESVQDPFSYYDVNVCGSIEVIRAMKTVGFNLLIFSSLAMVYGAPRYLPYNEDHPTVPQAHMAGLN
jgi:UDP-glucose 4-epimerase